jgi:hydroxyacylglutathione hydrolase
MFQRFFDEGLAQASFLIGCARTNEAVVIDPRRDASIYVAAAQQHGLTIVAAIETHVHADFVSGARELAAGGARVITGPGAGLQYEHHEARDGETLEVGDVRLRFLHTPGHTWEHISILAEAPGEPARLFTGDVLFVGGVGRPDLLGPDQTRRLASDLFDSLHRIMALDGAIEVHPGHGAGSLCGAGIGTEPSSTIARESRQNAMLQHAKPVFIEKVLADIPDTPPYFARMKRVNQEGPALLGLADGAARLASIRPAAAAALAADGAVIVDLRPAAAFAEGHPDGAINLGFGSKMGYWGGWVLPDDQPLLLLADDPAQTREAAVQLRRVGLDRIEGAIAGGYDAWAGSSLPVARLDQMSVIDLRAAMDHGTPMVIVDVRTPREWRSGHVEGAVNVPLGDIPARARELVGGGALVATICEGGYRSSLAASLLAQEGVAPLVNLTGGMAAFRAMEVR